MTLASVNDEMKRECTLSVRNGHPAVVSTHTPLEPRSTSPSSEEEQVDECASSAFLQRAHDCVVVRDPALRWITLKAGPRVERPQ
jgi:hypothetical protein